MAALVARRGMTLTDNIDDYPEGIILPVDKPYRWTSADVIRKVKYQAIRHFHKKNLKVGHAGTLDPLATGVLLVCIGKATKLAEELQASPKQYLAGVTFGATTPSYDLEKEIDREFPLDGVSEAALRSVLPGFVGEQDRSPRFSPPNRVTASAHTRWPARHTRRRNVPALPSTTPPRNSSPDKGSISTLLNLRDSFRPLPVLPHPHSRPRHRQILRYQLKLRDQLLLRTLLQIQGSLPLRTLCQLQGPPMFRTLY